MVTTTTSKPTTKSSEQLIEEYHLEAKQRCLAAYENDTHLQGYYCPCLPTTFGKLRTRNILHYDQSNRVAVETTAVPTKSVGHGSGWVLNFREACWIGTFQMRWNYATSQRLPSFLEGWTASSLTGQDAAGQPVTVSFVWHALRQPWVTRIPASVLSEDNCLAASRPRRLPLLLLGGNQGRRPVCVSSSSLSYMTSKWPWPIATCETESLPVIKIYNLLF